MRIGLDFDGVLSDCGLLKEIAAREIYGVDIPRDKFKKELVVASGVLTTDEYRRLQEVIYGTREYGLRMEACLAPLPFFLGIQRPSGSGDRGPTRGVLAGNP